MSAKISCLGLTRIGENYFFVCVIFFTHICLLVVCLSMTVWTHAVFGVLYACVWHFCICTCSAQLSMFHTEKRSRNTLIIVVVVIITIIIMMMMIMMMMMMMMMMMIIIQTVVHRCVGT